MGFFEQLLEGLRHLLTSKEAWDIVGLSLFVSLIAVILAILTGIPLGILLGHGRFRSQKVINILINTGMGLPPVFVGLIIYLLFARSGPLGDFRILFTPLGMIIAQFVLTLPIIVGVTRSRISELPPELGETLISLGANREQRRWQMLLEARSGIMVAIILALGRAFSEVGAIFIVGGNIRYNTRVLTTAIITEVSKGENELAIGLGITLLIISLILNTILTNIQMKQN